MAEKVKLTEAGDYTGAVLENAASEATLLRIATLLEARQKGAGSKAEQLRRKALEEGTVAQQGASRAADAFTGKLNTLNEAGKNVVDTFAKIAGMSIGVTFGLIQTAGEGLINFLKNGFDSFQQTVQVGAAFNNNLIDLRNTAANALIPIEQFTELIIQNSSTLAALGGTVTNGAKAFGDAAKIFNEEYGQELIGAGYSLNQMNESLMAYMDLQTRIGKLDLRNINTLAKGTKDYMMELDQVTKLTGISRKQAEELVKKASMDPILNSMLKNAKNQAQAAANIATLTKVGGDTALDMIKSMASRNPSEEARLLMAQTGATMEEARDILTGGIGSAETLKKMKNYADQLQQQGMLTDEYAEIMAAHNPAMANLIRTMIEFQKMDTSPEVLAKMEREQKARDAITSVFGNIGKALNNIYNKFIVRLTESRSFQVLQTKLEALAQAFENNETIIEDFANILVSTFTGAMDNFIKNVETEGIIKAVIDFFKDLFHGLKDSVYPAAKSLLANLFNRPVQQDTQPGAPGAPVTRGLPGAPDETSQQRFLREQGIPQQTNDLGIDFSPITDGLKAITNLVPGLGEFASYFGIAAGGSYLTGMGLSSAIGLVGTAITSGLVSALAALGPALTGLTPAIPVLATLAAGAGALGYAFNGISNIIDAVGNSFIKVKDFFYGMQDIDKEKIKGVGESLAPLTSQLTEIGKGAILNLIGGGGLTNLATSLDAMGKIDFSKFDGAGPSLKSLHDGLALFAQGGVLDSWGESVSSWFGGGQIDNILTSLTKFANIDFTKLASSERIPTAIHSLQESLNNLNIDQAKLDTLATVSNTVKTAFGNELSSSTSNVNTLTTSVDKLIDSLSKLEEQVKKTPKIGESLTGEVPTTPTAPGTPIINADDPQKQLNMKVDQMIEILTQMRDNTKDAADSLNNRRNAL